MKTKRSALSALIPITGDPMILRMFILNLEADNPVQFSIGELRAYLAGVLTEFTLSHSENSPAFLHRYPAVQCKMIKNTIVVVGISQGVDVLEYISRGEKKISPGKNACSIVGRDTAVREEQFGISDVLTTYEFLTPWLGLNQQNTKKFYDLTGKPERDAFLEKMLCEGLRTLAKSLDYKAPVPVTCEEKVRFRKDWIDNKSVMVFVGKFRTNLMIPDYLGMGRSVSLGFGTIRQIHDISKITADEAEP